MEQIYTEKDLVFENGHIFTSDNRFYLDTDEKGYDHWYEILKREDNILTIRDGAIGNFGTDFTFRSDIEGALTLLNNLVSRYNLKKANL